MVRWDRGGQRAGRGGVAQAIVSCYTHGCSFITVYADPDDPERILMIPRSADWSAALWDRRRRRVSAALTITDKGRGRSDHQLPGVAARRRVRGRTKGGVRGAGGASRSPRILTVPSVVPFVFDAQLNRPVRLQQGQPHAHGAHRFRAAHDGAHGGDRRVLFGAAHLVPGSETATSSAPTRGAASSASSTVCPPTRNGQKPTMQQLQQASMQPHSEMLAHDRAHGQRRDRHPGQRPGHHDGQSRVGRGDGRGRTQAQPHRRPSRTGVSAAR